MKLRFQPSTGFGSKLWAYKEEELSSLFRAWIRFLKIIVITVRDPFNKQLFNHAAALSFQLLLSLIPLLAMVFAVAKGFGVQDKIETILLEKTVGGGIADSLIPKILEYVDKTNVKALGYIGLAFILYTSISMLGQIENSFNSIWEIGKPRTLIRKFTDYLALLILGPLLLAITLGLSTTLSSHAFTQKLLEIGLFAGAMKLFLLSLPWLSSILVIFLIYIIIPNTTVHIRSALFAGIVAGLSWQVTQISFISFQVGVAKYNAIYGTFASVPIFMIWLYVSWVIVLAGALLNFACQHVGDFQVIDFNEELHFSAQEKICMCILLLICREFNRDASKLTASEISKKLKIPTSLVESSLEHLEQINMVVPVEHGAFPAYIPARPIEQIKMADFFQNLKLCDGQEFDMAEGLDVKQANAILADLTTVIEEKFGQENISLMLESSASDINPE